MKIKMVVYGVVFVLGIVLLFGACQSVATGEEEYSYELEKSIPYSVVDDTELLLDVAWPTSGKGPYPAIVFLYGGGWTGGFRGMLVANIREAAKRGYVAIAPDYRLVVKNIQDDTYSNQFPAAVHDVMCAVRWLRANAEQYNVDQNKIGAHGFSAGGHLALMLGVTDSSDGWESEGEYADFSSKVQAVVSSAGPTDLKRCAETSIVIAEALLGFIGGTTEQVPDLYKKASPITYVSSDDAPALLIQGSQDNWIPYEQAVLFSAEMQSVGVPYTVVFFKGPHGEGPIPPDVIYEFFDMYLKNTN